MKRIIILGIVLVTVMIAGCSNPSHGRESILRHEYEEQIRLHRITNRDDSLPVVFYPIIWKF